MTTRNVVTNVELANRISVIEERLDAIEGKLDKVIAFVDNLEGTFDSLAPMMESVGPMLAPMLGMFGAPSTMPDLNNMKIVDANSRET